MFNSTKFRWSGYAAKAGGDNFWGKVKPIGEGHGAAFSTHLGGLESALASKCCAWKAGCNNELGGEWCGTR